MSQQYTQITLITPNNAITNARYYPAKPGKQGVIMVGGIGGNYDSPSKNLYPTLAAKLSNEGIQALRVEFRYPTLLEESVQDVLAGAKFLHTEGVVSLGLVGHSFGGAVVIGAAVQLGAVKTVVTLATQSFGADMVEKLSKDSSILFIHGAKDETLSPRNSEVLYDLAQARKRLEVLAGNRHGLDESANQVFTLVHDWLIQELK